MKEKRQLAAIMFTDIVGYTALMGQDEQHAKQIRDRHREVLQKQIEENSGKILQYYGDGTLSIFDSALDAVRSSIAIQKELQADPSIPIRIGIHTGDIVYDDADIYGDGVNISSRIQSLSVPGGVLISEKVFDEIKNHPEIKTISLGSFDLKNVKKPIEVLAIANEGVVIPSEQEIRAGSNAAEVSIAVLPFINMSAEAENEYFSDGISEELINVLSRVEGIRVTSRTSSFTYKGKQDDIRNIGKQLNVRNVLEGSVRKAGNRVRIGAQLISVSDGYQVWSEIYNRDLEDIFEVQDDIARIISNKLREKLGLRSLEGVIVENPTSNMEAYNLYLKGLFHWNKQHPEDLIKAIDFFREAISKANDFALPYAALAVVYAMVGSRGLFDPAEAASEGMKAAHRALELNPDLGDAHMALGLFKLFYEWDLAESYKYFQKALLLTPGKAIMHYAYGFYLTAARRFDEAIEYLMRAVQLDPFSIPFHHALGYAYLMVGRIDEGQKEFEKIQELEPDARSGPEGIATAYMIRGDFQKAIPIFESLQKKIGNELKGLCRLGYAYGKHGNLEKAHECLEKLQIRQEVEKNIFLHFDYALIYTGLGEREKAMKYLEKAYEDHIGELIIVINNPVFESLRDMPGFKKLQEKLHAKSKAPAHLPG